jgi:small-conductance mechanosensitive channel
LKRQWKSFLRYADAEDRVIQDPKPKVFVKEFADSGINLHIACFVVDPNNGFLELKSDIYRAVFEDLRRMI